MRSLAIAQACELRDHLGGLASCANRFCQLDSAEPDLGVVGSVPAAMPRRKMGCDDAGWLQPSGG